MGTKALFLRRCRLFGHLGPGAVLLRDGVIAGVGKEAALRAEAASLRAGDVDLEGRQVVSGFIDAHMHLLAYAARLVSVDCRGADSISAIQGLIGRRAAQLPSGTWVRATGYDEMALRERRHPTRRDLDAAAPEHPVRLTHRGGHAAVLNSLALRLAGIDGATPEPAGGYMGRDLGTGEPNGLLIEMNDLIERAVPRPGPGELRAAVAEASRNLLAAGVTYVEDATPSNGRDEWRLFRELQAQGALRQAMSLMEGVEHLSELPEGEGRLRRGPVKVMPRELEHEFHPSFEDLGALLRRIQSAGRRAAVHVVTRNGLDCVLAAFESLDRPAPGHRLEHCGICSPAQAQRIAALGLAVVTQPGFLFENGDLILRRLREEDVPDLYPVRRLLDAGVDVAGSSDAPVAEPRPLAGIRGAVTRRSKSGAAMGLDHAIRPALAVELFTSRAARVLGVERQRGTIAAGQAADLVVLDGWRDGAAPGWDDLRVHMTLVEGEIVYERA